MNIIQEILNLSQHETKTLYERGLKLGEEFGEVSEAILSSSGAPGCKYKGKTHSDVLEEAVDVTIVAMSIAGMYAADESALEEIFQKKLNKWKEKIEEK